MNRCKRVLLVLSLMLLASAAPAWAQLASQLPDDAKPGPRTFPKDAKRGELVIVAPPSITVDGKEDRFSPGVRIRDAGNHLVLSGTLVNQKLPVRYLRDNIGLVHQVWVLSDEEARLRMPGEGGGGLLGNIRSLFDPPPPPDYSNTPYKDLPVAPQRF